MRVTIVPSDGVVGIDGVFRQVAGLAAMLPDVHAVQWNGGGGEVEFIDGSPNEFINTLAAFQSAIDAWNALTPPPKTEAELLAEAKEARIEVMEAAYQQSVGADISYLGSTFQADADSQALIAAVLTASGGTLPQGFVWYDKLNLPVPMSLPTLQGLAGAILMRGQPLFERKQARKASIRAATTIAEVEAVTW